MDGRFRLRSDYGLRLRRVTAFDSGIGRRQQGFVIPSATAEAPICLSVRLIARKGIALKSYPRQDKNPGLKLFGWLPRFSGLGLLTQDRPISRCSKPHVSGRPPDNSFRCNSLDRHFSLLSLVKSSSLMLVMKL